jgi:hypothetical protein
MRYVRRLERDAAEMGDFGGSRSATAVRPCSRLCVSQVRTPAEGTGNKPPTELASAWPSRRLFTRTQHAHAAQSKQDAGRGESGLAVQPGVHVAPRAPSPCALRLETVDAGHRAVVQPFDVARQRADGLGLDELVAVAIEMDELHAGDLPAGIGGDGDQGVAAGVTAYREVPDAMARVWTDGSP